jgi:hypothetical protein
MLFFKEALDNKMNHLDGILSRPELLVEVVKDHLGPMWEFSRINRFWEPGGGSTLFRLSDGTKNCLLKVKHHSVFVESRLESESDFMRVPSLRNEHDFLQKLLSDLTPLVVFYDERDEYCFLALEWLETFSIAVERLAADELMMAWDRLESFVRSLYQQGIVHTDIHEGNICFSGNSPVLCDFEETRYLLQDVAFEDSLDYQGKNRFGNVGDFPASTGKGIGGLTCLDRLRKVFRKEILAKLPAFLESCNFDGGCPFNLDELQEEDRRVYQSIAVGDIRVSGQRPEYDTRKEVLRYFLRRLSRRFGPVSHLDIGSNMGMFCFCAAELPFVQLSTGLEAFSTYVVAADLLKFLIDTRKVRFRKFVCGKNALDDIDGRVDFCTMLSVYHHIADKDRFLDDLVRKRPHAVLAELATQERYYPERGDVWREIQYIKERLRVPFAHHIMFSRDYHRPMVLFSHDSLSLYDRIMLRLLNGAPAALVRLVGCM